MVDPLQKCASFSEEETAEPIAAVPEPPVNSCREGEGNLLFYFCDTIIAQYQYSSLIFFTGGDEVSSPTVEFPECGK